MTIIGLESTMYPTPSLPFKGRVKVEMRRDS